MHETTTTNRARTRTTNRARTTVEPKLEAEPEQQPERKLARPWNQNYNENQKRTPWYTETRTTTINRIRTNPNREKTIRDKIQDDGGAQSGREVERNTKPETNTLYDST